MNKLKPCPFCGGKATTENYSSGGKMIMIKCADPNCKMSVYVVSQNPDEAKDLWNRRVNQND